MASAAQITEQITQCTQLFAAQAGAGLGDDHKVMTMQGMAKSFIAQIASLPSLDIGGSTTLQLAIGNSPFTPELKAGMAAAVASRAMSAHASGGVKSYHKTQTLDHPLAYLTQCMWDRLNNTKVSQLQRCAVVADLLGSLNLLNPKEETIRGFASALAASQWPDSEPTPAELHSLVLDLKAAIGNKVRNDALPHIVAFPLDPRDLPAELHASAYREDDQPVSKDLPRYRHMYKSMIMRSSNKKLKPDPGCGRSSRDPRTTTDPAQCLDSQNVIAMLLSALGIRTNMGPKIEYPSPRGSACGRPSSPLAIADGSAGGGSSSATGASPRDGEAEAAIMPAAPPLQLPPEPTAEVQGAAVAGATALAGGGGLAPAAAFGGNLFGGVPRSGVDLVAEMERVAGGKLGGLTRPAARRHSQKGAPSIGDAARVATEHAGSKKRPAAAPAGTMLGKDDKVCDTHNPGKPTGDIWVAIIAYATEWKPEFKLKSRRYFVDRAYHRAEARAAKANFSKEDVGTIRREANRKAGSIWDTNVG